MLKSLRMTVVRVWTLRYGAELSCFMSVGFPRNVDEVFHICDVSVRKTVMYDIWCKNNLPASPSHEINGRPTPKNQVFLCVQVYQRGTFNIVVGERFDRTAL